MRRIVLGLVLALLFWLLPRDVCADDGVSSSGVGLGLTTGGTAVTLVSGGVLLGMWSCRPEPNGEGCPPRGEQKAVAIALITGIVMLGVGIPLYLTASPDERRAGTQQAASAFNAMTVRLAFR
jgi:hypothetical protein